MDVYLIEVFEEEVNGGCYEYMTLHLPGTDIWLDNVGYNCEHIENIKYTDKFWRCVAEGNVLLTRLGEL